jgi:hypothetical protein
MVKLPYDLPPTPMLAADHYGHGGDLEVFRYPIEECMHDQDMEGA